MPIGSISGGISDEIVQLLLIVIAVSGASQCSLTKATPGERMYKKEGTFTHFVTTKVVVNMTSM